MSVDLDFLQLTAIIVHDIPVRYSDREGDSPVYSEVAAPFDEDVRRFLQEQIRATLDGHGADVRFRDDSRSPVRQHVAALSRGSKALVETSKAIGEHLFETQKGNASPGLLLVLPCRVKKDRGVAIVKLEREEGARILKETVGKKQTLAVELIRDLMLTRRTRVFKTALFLDTRDGQWGRISDPQNVRVADFFIDRFLGCELLEHPRVSTERYFEATHDFINSAIEDPQTRAQAYMSLISGLSSGLEKVDPKGYARASVPEPQQAAYVAHLKERGVPARRFEKDTSLIATKITRVLVMFRSGIAIIAPPQTDGHTMKMKSTGERRLQVTVNDEVTQLRGRSR